MREYLYRGCSRCKLKKLRGQSLDELFDAILALENREECYQFFDDLCTVNEIQSLSQRLQVAKND